MPLPLFILSTKLIQITPYSSFKNFNIFLRQSKIVLKLKEIGIEQLSLTIARRERLHLYIDGINERLDSLSRQYLIKIDELDTDGWVVDVGANIGEFSYNMRRSGFTKFLCIEPEEKEAASCDDNVFQGEKKTIRACLWAHTGTLKFYHHNES
jgi:hypothetical protein